MRRDRHGNTSADYAVLAVATPLALLPVASAALWRARLPIWP